MDKITEKEIDVFRHGDSISDASLDRLLEFYADLEKKLKILGPTYHLAWKDVFYDKLRLEDYKTARNNHKN